MGGAYVMVAVVLKHHAGNGDVARARGGKGERDAVQGLKIPVLIAQVSIRLYGYAISEDIITMRCFDENSNDWLKSELRAWLIEWAQEREED